MKNIAITKDVQSALTPNGVLQDLLDGNSRFVGGTTLRVQSACRVGWQPMRSRRS